MPSTRPLTATLSSALTQDTAAAAQPPRALVTRTGLRAGGLLTGSLPRYTNGGGWGIGPLRLS